MTDHIAHAEIEIDANPSRVWRALTDPAEVKAYFFGTDLVTDWQPGSPIYWRGEWKGKPYEDKGEILKFEPDRLLRTTHFSPLTGQDDVPENYHEVSYALSETGSGTKVELTQTNNPTAEQAEQFNQTWQGLLDGLKEHIESKSVQP